MGTATEMFAKEKPITAEAQKAFGAGHDYGAYIRVIVAKCEEALRAHPSDADYYVIMARAFADRTPLQDVAKAKALFQKALAIDPNNQYAYDRLGRYGDVW